MLLLGIATLALAPPLVIRTAIGEITPPEPLPLGGYTERHGRVMEEGGEKLYARFLGLEQGNVKVAIVSVEMLTVPESLYREVRSKIPKDVHLFLQATHTHSAPDSQMLNDRMKFSIPGIASFRSRWLDWYSEKIAKIVSDGLSGTGFKPATLSMQRALVDANRARRKDGKPDPYVNSLSASDPDRLLFTEYAAHGIVYDSDNNRTNGDWPGEIARDTRAPVLIGAIGDVSPAADGKTAEERMRDFKTKFNSSDKAFRFTVWKPQMSPLTWKESEIALDQKRPHPEFMKDYGVPEVLAKTLVNQFAPPEAEVVAFRIGDLAVVGIPGEPTSILGNQIQAAGEKMGLKSVLVCSHVNGWIGYLLDPVDYDRGEYEATLSFYGRDEGPKVVKAAVAALNDLLKNRPIDKAS